MTFEFATATRIIFGEGSADQLPQLARDLGSHLLLVCGSNAERHADLIASLSAAGLRHTICPIAGEPSVEMAEQAKGSRSTRRL